MKYAAVLLSRQALRPSSRSLWIKNARRAVCFAAKNGYRILTSIGMQTWEFLLFASAREGIDQRIIIPASDTAEFENQCFRIKDQFCLKGNVDFFHLPVEKAGDEESMIRRDSVIVESADLLIPVSIRKKGAMESLIQKVAGSGKEIDTSFQIPYENRTEKISRLLDPSNLNDQLSGIKKDYVVHWTRSSNGPWPTEKMRDYYSAVVESENYPRNAYSTLINILLTQRIVSSQRHMPGNEKMVSFTANRPLEFIHLMRWRSRYVEMSFEPYGIGIDLSCAIEIGIKKVIYLDDRKTIQDPLYSQSKGKKGSWIEENEYRFHGDFDLNTVPKDKLICFCLKSAESLFVEKTFGIRSVSIYKAD